MPWFTRLAFVLALLGVPAVLQAQYPQQTPEMPPLLYVRLAGPSGMKVTIYRGGPQSQTLDTPCVVAFRPGYRFQIELSHLPDRAGPQSARPTNPITICPTLAVLGSLRVCSNLRPQEHPATIVFTEDDFATVRAGAVVTKVVLLERPETALPVATKSDQPLEITVPPNIDPMQEAMEHGRPLLVLQMGERQITPEELTVLGKPGTVQLPGEKVLSTPHDPPCLPWMCYPLIDPRTGLPSPAEEICFHDGGDSGPQQAGIGPNGKLVGLDPSDTIAQYADSRGNQKLAISNVVCLCVPRYLLIRNAIAPAANSTRTGPGNTRIAQSPAKAQLETGSVQFQQDLFLAGLANLQKLGEVNNAQQTVAVGKVDGLVVYAKAEGTGTVTGKCAEPAAVEPIEKLVIWKWPDKCELQLGDIVTFYIRYKNQGQRPITEVVVNDSLTARLEYVPNSARADRDALFTITPNEANSAVLRWEVTGALPPGEMGTVTFQARVR